MRSGIFILLLALCLPFGLQPAAAQTAFQFEVGPRLGFDLNGDIEEFFIGADGRVGLPDLPVQFNGAFDIYLAGNSDDFIQFSINGLYHFGTNNQVFTPYTGLGLGISRFNNTNDTGLNLIGGATFSVGTLKPFGQVQLTLGDIDLVTLGGGLLFELGH